MTSIWNGIVVVDLWLKRHWGPVVVVRSAIVGWRARKGREEGTVQALEILSWANSLTDLVDQIPIKSCLGKTSSPVNRRLGVPGAGQ